MDEKMNAPDGLEPPEHLTKDEIAFVLSISDQNPRFQYLVPKVLPGGPCDIPPTV